MALDAFLSEGRSEGISVDSNVPECQGMVRFGEENINREKADADAVWKRLSSN